MTLVMRVAKEAILFHICKMTSITPYMTIKDGHKLHQTFSSSEHSFFNSNGREKFWLQQILLLSRQNSGYTSNCYSNMKDITCIFSTPRSCSSGYTIVF